MKMPVPVPVLVRINVQLNLSEVPVPGGLYLRHRCRLPSASAGYRGIQGCRCRYRRQLKSFFWCRLPAPAPAPCRCRCRFESRTSAGAGYQHLHEGAGANIGIGDSGYALKPKIKMPKHVSGSNLMDPPRVCDSNKLLLKPCFKQF